MDNKDERIQLSTLNGKNRSFMFLKEYSSLRDFILDALQQHQQISLMKLMELAINKFSEQFSGDVALLVLNTKRDLEARGLIKIAHEKDRTQLISLKRNERKMSLSGGCISKLHTSGIAQRARD